MCIRKVQEIAIICGLMWFTCRSKLSPPQRLALPPRKLVWWWHGWSTWKAVRIWFGLEWRLRCFRHALINCFVCARVVMWCFEREWAWCAQCHVDVFWWFCSAICSKMFPLLVRIPRHHCVVILVALCFKLAWCEWVFCSCDPIRDCLVDFLVETCFDHSWCEQADCSMTWSRR